MKSVRGIVLLHCILITAYQMGFKREVCVVLE